jgi:hypothetical protein
MRYCNESVTDHVKCINFYLEPLFGIVIDLVFQLFKNFCNIFRNEHTGSVYAQLFSLKPETLTDVSRSTVSRLMFVRNEGMTHSNFRK